MSNHYHRRHWSLQQRLDHWSVPDPETGCILWAGTRSKWGYGQLTIRGRTLKAHRVAWEAKNGPIPAGLNVCHRCDVRTCINPDHLFLGTQKDNMADMYTKMGHERRTEGGPERRPSKAPEIVSFHMRGEEFVARLLKVRRLADVVMPPARKRSG